MGVRNRNGERKVHEKLVIELHIAQKKFTRAKAEKALANGADPTEERFTKHANYHVRAKAWRKAGMPIPSGSQEDLDKFFKSIHYKPKADVYSPIEEDPNRQA